MSTLATGIDPPTVLLVIGILIGIAETFIPGSHLFVVGAGMVFAGAIGMLFPPAAHPIALGVLVAVGGVVTLGFYRRAGIIDGDSADKTTDSNSLKGKVGHVTETVTKTSGEVKLENGGFDPYYQARAATDQIEEGTEVVVLDPGGGNILTVQAIESSNTVDEIDRELETV